MAGRGTSVPHLHNDLVAPVIRKFIPATSFSPVSTGTQASGTRVYLAKPNEAWLEITNTAFPCRRFDATSGLGAYASVFWTVPDDLDVGSPTYVVVYWASSDTVASQTATWAVTYSTLAEGAALAQATTALNTTIVADTDDTDAYGVNITAEGTINAASLTNDQTLNLRVQLSAVSGLSVTEDNILLLGVEVRYTRRFI
jgi:hypothetical protein